MKQDSRKPDVTEIRTKLEQLRVSLLDLHKALIESEKTEYEQVIGKIQSPNHFLQLLTTDPWFAWLSPLSQVIVSIDEALDADEPLTVQVVEALTRESSRLLMASEQGEGFSKHYFDALQRDPDVVMAHAQVARLRGWRDSQR